MEAVKLVKTSSAATPQPTLDEITNRVFEELLQGKAESKIVYDQRSAKVNFFFFTFYYYNTLYSIPNLKLYILYQINLIFFQSEDWGSEHSSGIFGRFLRRDSTMFDKLRVKIIFSDLFLSN